MPTQTPTIDRAEPLTFESPDGHTWVRDVDHQSRPRTRALQAPFERAFRDGWRAMFSRYGMPLLEGRAAHVHGWLYLRMVPAGAPDRPGPSKPPPPLVLKLLGRVHPELRRRAKQATETVETRRWLADATAWDRERRRWVDQLRDRTRRDLEALDDAALAGEIDELADLGEAMLRRHFELTGPMLGIGRLLVEAQGRGIEPHEVIATLQGASPASAATLPVLGALADEVDRHGASPSDVDGLRAVSARAADLVDEYLLDHGWRVLAGDLDGATVAEQPQLLLDAVAHQRDERRSPAATPKGVREPMTAGDRADHDRLLDEARTCYACLDDNSGFASWALGALRRGLLEAGRRLTTQERLHDPDHVLALELGETGRLLRGEDGPGADDVAERVRFRIRSATAEPPTVLGPPEEMVPDPSVFPTDMGCLVEWVGRYLGLRFPSPGETAATGRVLLGGAVVATGHGVNEDRVTATACVVSDPDEAVGRLEPGQILVCPFTTPAYNVVFPLVSGVVTEFGGPLGHAAVMAREFGFPAVVGTGPLTVADGDEITVDSGTSG